MKKIFSLLLVFTLLFGSLELTFALPKDIKDTVYEDAVKRLVALDILSGFPDGNFKPRETVTRAQCAKIMVHIIGIGDTAQYATSQTKFSDVPTNHWAAGYINVASSVNIINGYGNGKFGPEDKVTYAQAITMLVRALGYEPKAQALGGYPQGYIAVAAEEDITKDINVVGTLAANRGDIALMVDVSLDVNLMYQKVWGSCPEYTNDDDSKTLLKTKLHVDEICGRVIGVPSTDRSLDAKEIKVRYTTEDDKTKTEKYELLVSKVNIDALFGLEVTLWADENEAINLDIDTDTDDILFDTVDGDADRNEITLYVEDDTFDWARNAEVYVNFEEVRPREVPDKAYGYFVLNDKEEVVYANLFDFNEIKAGAVYNVDGDVFKYVEQDASDDEIELSDYEDGVYIYNEKMELVNDYEIDVNGAIFGWEDDDKLYLMVKNHTVKGKLERTKNNEVRINGETYNKSEDGAAYSDDRLDSFDEYTDVESLNNLCGERVTAVMDLKDELIFIYGDTEGTSSTKYGVVTYADIGAKSEATIFTQDGREQDYVFEDRKDVMGIEQGNSSNDIDYFEKQGDGLVFSVMKFKLNRHGEIDSDYLTDSDADEERMDVIDFSRTTELLKDSKKRYVWIDEDGDDDTNDRTKYYISEDTVFMTALDNDGYLEPDLIDYEDIYKSKIVMSDAGRDTQVYVYGEVGKDADFILFLNKAFTGFDDDYYYGVVIDGPWRAGKDDVAEIDVFGEGKDEYILANDNHFSEGKVVKFHYNIDGEIVRDAIGNKDDDGNFDYDDGYLINTDDGTVRIPSNAVIYELDSHGNIEDKVKRHKVDDSKFKTLVYILNEDEDVAAAIVEQEVSGEVIEAEATITGDAVFNSINDKINVKLKLAENITPPDEISNYILMVYKAPNDFHGGFSFNSDVITANGQNFSCADLNLSDYTTYITKVMSMVHQEVLAQKGISTLNPVGSQNQDEVDAARNSLDYEDLIFSDGEDQHGVKGNITLPETLDDYPGVIIEWSANTVDGATIASDGTVTRSSTDDENDDITLTAALTKDSYTATKAFTITIIEEKPPETPASFTASDDANASTISLAWDSQSNDTDLDHFEIYYNLESSATDNNTAVDTNISKNYESYSFDASSLTNGDNVYFALYAVDEVGNKVKTDANVIYQNNETYEINVSQTEDYVFPAQDVGYTPIDPLEVTITKTGTGDIENLLVQLDEENKKNFKLLIPEETTLNESTPFTTFIIKPKNKLLEGTYSATMKITADNGINQVLNVSFTVN